MNDLEPNEFGITVSECQEIRILAEIHEVESTMVRYLFWKRMLSRMLACYCCCFSSLLRKVLFQADEDEGGTEKSAFRYLNELRKSSAILVSKDSDGLL